MSLVSSIEWGACLLEPQPDPELKRQIVRETGLAPGSVAYFSATPEIAQMIGRLSLSLRSRIHLDGHVSDLVGLVVSQDNSCRFCYAYQRAVMRSFGFSEDRIEKLEQGLFGADLERKQKLALDFARKVSRSNPLPGEADKRPLRDVGYSEIEIQELIAQIGLFVYHNRIATLPALPSEWIEALPETWYSKLFRPLIGLYMRKQFPAGKEVKLAPGEEAGPFANIVSAFDGLPFAGVLRSSLDVVLADGALPGRAKLTAFAVVARALGCPVTEREAVRALTDDFGMTSQTVQGVLAHLTAPELDERESLIVPFARDTVWYGQATPIQQRAREMRSRLKLEEFLEMITAVAVANMVCRLGIALPGACDP